MMSTKALTTMAVAAYRRGLRTPERVAEALQEIIQANEEYIAKPNRQGATAQRFNQEVVRRSEVLAAAVVLLESGTDMDIAWLRRYTEHVARYVSRCIAVGQAEDLGMMLEHLPPLPKEGRRDVREDA